MKAPKSVATLRKRFHDWRQPRPFGVLGDVMAPSERITWGVMKVYRRWTVFILLQLLTVLWWTHPSLFPGGLLGWNYVWSDLAIIVEMMVGIAFLNQAMRDGAFLRTEVKELRQQMDLLHQVAVEVGVEGDTKRDVILAHLEQAAADRAAADAKRDLILAHLEQAAADRAEVKEALHEIEDEEGRGT